MTVSTRFQFGSSFCENKKKAMMCSQELIPEAFSLCFLFRENKTNALMDLGRQCENK